MFEKAEVRCEFETVTLMNIVKITMISNKDEYLGERVLIHATLDIIKRAKMYGGHEVELCESKIACLPNETLAYLEIIFPNQKSLEDFVRKVSK